jgi:hypothetical protein
MSLLVTGNQHTKYVTQNISYLCMRHSDHVWNKVKYSRFLKPCFWIRPVQIYGGYYRRCFWFESLLRYRLSTLRIVVALQCSGGET